MRIADLLSSPATASQASAIPVPGAPGRSCPAHYRYGPTTFATHAPPALQDLEVLYLVGGLYGNELALQRVLALFERERGRKQLVFNGDFHWFDADESTFASVQRQVLEHVALRGNVETELADESASGDAGCGCAYPDWVGDEVVERSNGILARLRGVTSAAQRAALAALPMTQRATVGALEVGIVHGDAESLAGWGFAQEHLRQAAQRRRVSDWFDAAQVQVFASSHTCLPVSQRRADGAGLLTRIALSAHPGPERRFGLREGAVHMEALAIEFDAPAWQRRFLQCWPAGSAAHASYFTRIARGPDYGLDEALRRED